MAKKSTQRGTVHGAMKSGKPPVAPKPKPVAPPSAQKLVALDLI
jgi:hypothetical protein